MGTKPTTAVDVSRARQIWQDYCQSHDVAAHQEQTAGIEPTTGRVWFGESAGDVHDKMIADGVDLPAYFIRVGYDYYARKGIRR